MQEKTTLERVERLLEAYGADAARWPARERAQALAVLQDSPRLEDYRRQAQELDALLDRALPPFPDRELLADLQAVPASSGWYGWAALIWPFGPIWKPAVGLTMAAAVGLVLGLTAAPPVEFNQINSEIEGLILG